MRRMYVSGLILTLALLLSGCGYSSLRNGNGLIGNKAIEGPVCFEQVNETVTRAYSC